jgi:hypothetical protein
MSLQPQPSTPQASPPIVEVSWDDALDGKFPPTRQQRLQQAVTQAAEQVFTQPAVQANPERLHKAMDLVLTGAVTLQEDGTATVKSGSHTYQINGECTCGDAQHRTRWCKHYLAVRIQRRATALLQGTAHDPAPAPERAEPSASQPDAPASPAALPPSAPSSAAWDVHEAPASTCFRFRIGNMELMHTMRGVDDAEILARIKDTLPLLQDIIDACEDRYATRLAEREAAKAAPAAPAPQAQPPASAPADLQALIQQAIQQALAAQGNSQAPSPAPAAGATGQPPGAQPPAPPTPPQPADTPEGYCAIHQVQMYLNSNERGSWYSHRATDDDGQEYFCKGRPRRNGR